MISVRTLVRCSLVSLLIFGFLMVPWPGVRELYATVFHFQANLVYGGSDGDHFIEFQSNVASGAAEDTAIHVGRRRDPGYTNVTFRSRFVGYLPMALFLALVLSTPIPIGRRLHALWKGGLAIDAYVLLRTGLLVLKGWTEHRSHCSASHAAFWSSGWWDQLLDKTVAILVLEPSMYILVPGLVWLAVTFPLSSLRALVGSAATPPAPR